jgi:predicted Zn-dependent peptidase
VSEYARTLTRLDNGLRVVTVSMPHLHSASISVYVRVGSRHETAATNGLSHFLEHMFFRGADGFPDSTALNAAMEDLGGHLDGYTTRDYSAFQSTVHPDHVGDATDLLGRIFVAPHFTEMEIERSIILEEVLDALDERGREIELDTIAHRSAFGDHPLAQSIDGPKKNLKRFTEDDLQTHRRRFYGANNSVLCFAGRISPTACRRYAKKSFGSLFGGKRATEGPRPKILGDPTVRFVSSDDAQTRARLTFRVEPESHADFPALLLLRRVLDGGLSARLQVELVEKRGIVYEISAGLDSYSDCALFDFELAVAHKKLPYALEELAKVLLDLRDHGVTEEELDRVRRRARFGVEFGLDSTMDLSHWFGALQLWRDPIRPEERLQQLEAVSTHALLRAARKYFTPARMSFAAVGGASRAQVKEARAVLRAFQKECSSSQR